MAWVLPAAMIAGGVMSAVGQQQQGKATASAANQAAQDTVNSQALTELQKRKDIETVSGQQKVAYVNSGVTMSGSPMSVMLDTLANQELDIKIDQLNTQKQVRAYQAEAKNAVRAGNVGAISTLLTTGAQVGYNYYPRSTAKTKIGQ